MAAKKTYSPKPETVEVELTEVNLEAEETLEVEEVELPEVEYVKTPEPVETPSSTYTVKAGDTWASISDRLRPDGTTKHLYAEFIQKLNGGTLTAGRTINL